MKQIYIPVLFLDSILRKFYSKKKINVTAALVTLKKMFLVKKS